MFFFRIQSCHSVSLCDKCILFSVAEEGMMGVCSIADSVVTALDAVFVQDMAALKHILTKDSSQAKVHNKTHF